MARFQSMVAGRYYVGDLCYVMGDRWEEVCALTIDDKHGCLEGEFNLKDGTRFAMYRTAWGDGEYKDNHGASYCVDSGTIGCILVDDITDPEFDENTDLGQILTFKDGFTTSSDEGHIRFDALFINTKDDEEEYCDYCGGEGHDYDECGDRMEDEEEEDYA